MISSVNLSGAAASLLRTATAETQAAASAGSSAAIAARATRLAKSAVRGAATGLTGAGRPARSGGRAVTRKSSGAGYAGAASSASKKSASKAGAAGPSSKTGADDPLAFLRDSKLSIEEKLMRLLAHLNAQWEKDMQKQLDAFKGPSEAGGTSKGKTASGKEKSLLGKAAGAAREFLPGVGFALDALADPAVRAVATKLGGPVLAAAATAVGFPALAPALLKWAPDVIDAAAEVASAVAKDGSGSKAGGSSGSSGTGGTGDAGKSGGTTMSASEQQLAFMEIQRLREKQKEMFALVSNTLKSGHDLRMGVIANMR